MPNRSVTITATSVGNDISTVDIYGTSVTSGNLITASITTASLEAGFTFDADEDHYTFLCTLGGTCGTTSSIALIGAPVASWSPVGTEGPDNASIETIGGEVISASLADIAYDGSGTFMIAARDNVGWVLTSVDGGLSWLKEEHDDAPVFDVSYVSPGSTDYWVGASKAYAPSTQCMVYSSNDGDSFSKGFNTSYNNNRICLYTCNEGNPTACGIGIASTKTNEWHLYTMNCDSYIHTYDSAVYGSTWGTTPTTGNLNVLIPYPGSPVPEPARYTTANAFCVLASNTRYLWQHNPHKHLKSCAMCFPHRAITALEHLSPTIDSTYRDYVFIGAENGQVHRGRRRRSISTTAWSWNGINSGTTNTNFTIGGMVGITGSSADPKQEVWGATLNTDCDLGTFITSSDGGTSWVNYTAGGLSKGEVSHMFTDGNRIIGVGASGSKGKLIQSRDDRFNVDWLEATTCHPLRAGIWGDDVYLAVGDSGSIYRGV